MTTNHKATTIYDLPPLETGGMLARKGFSFQDHVAAGFCLEMLQQPTLLQVWCESQDDITLIWQVGDHEEVEFVQVKNEQPDQLWTSALIYTRENKRVGSSIAEKSLAHDRCSEPCCFRLVTSREVSVGLKLLAYPLEAQVRAFSSAEFNKLVANFTPSIGDYRSTNGNDISFWLQNLVWEVKHSEDAVKKENLLHLVKVLGNLDLHLSPDQMEETIYNRLLWMVYNAALADANADAKAKRILQNDLKEWLKERVLAAQTKKKAGGRDLEDKMHDAGLPPDTVESAVEYRRKFRHETLMPRYMEIKDRDLAEREIAAVLHTLKAKLDAGHLPDVGLEFHVKCLDELESLRTSLSTTTAPPRFFFLGCMYDITDRCLHRFRKVQA